MKMKVLCAAVAFLMTFLSPGIMAREASRVEEPEFVGVVFLLDSTTHKLVALERQLPVAKTKVKGFGGMDVSVEMDGEKSPVRFKATQKLIFVVRVENSREDPNGTFGMSFFDSKKGKRVRGVIKVKPLGLGTSKPSTPAALDITLGRYGESSMKMEVVSELQPGEYCVGHVTSKANFCFGVDPGETGNSK